MSRCARILLLVLMASASLTAVAEDWETNAELFRAARAGNAAGVKSALAAGADVHAKTPEGESALMLAVRARNAEAAQLVLDAGAADINETYRFEKFSAAPLAIASWSNAPALVELLLKRGADVKANSQFALRGAIVNESPEMVLALLGAGADVNVRFKENGESPLAVAATRENLKVIEILIERGAKLDLRDDRGNTALMFAASLGRVATVELLVQRGAAVNLFDTDGLTALAAAQATDPEMRARVEKVLLAAGAKREAVQRPVDEQYLLAAHQGDLAKVKQLLDQGAELEVRGKPNITLWLRDALAASVAHPEVCALLLERGINPFMRDGGGFTALHTAAMSGSVACIDLLRRAGLDPNDKAKHGQTAIYMADNSRRPQAIKSALTEDEMSAPPQLVCAADADARQEVRVRHLHIPAPEAATIPELQPAYRKMQLARSELLAGKPFAEVSQRYTNYRKAAPNPEGDLGFVKRKFLPSQMDRVVFCLPVGEISPVFRTSFGFHIVQVIETR